MLFVKKTSMDLDKLHNLCYLLHHILSTSYHRDSLLQSAFYISLFYHPDCPFLLCHIHSIKISYISSLLSSRGLHLMILQVSATLRSTSDVISTFDSNSPILAGNPHSFIKSLSACIPPLRYPYQIQLLQIV